MQKVKWTESFITLVVCFVAVCEVESCQFMIPFERVTYLDLQL